MGANEMSEPRTFPTETILSVTTHHLLTDGGMAAVHECMEYLAGEPVWSHQLPRVAEELTPWLHELHPIFAKYDQHGLASGPYRNYREWRDAMLAEIGPTLTVRPIPRARHTSIDPITEAVDMMFDEEATS
jgi:hypothetical protein